MHYTAALHSFILRRMMKMIFCMMMMVFCMMMMMIFCMMMMIFCDADDDRHYIRHVKPVGACVAECFVLLVSFW